MALGFNSINSIIVLSSFPHQDNMSFMFLKTIYFSEMFFIRGFTKKWSKFAHFKVKDEQVCSSFNSTSVILMGNPL